MVFKLKESPTSVLNKFDLYLERLVQTKFLNLQRSLKGEEELSLKPYINNEEFTNDSRSTDEGYELISSIQYSFDCSNLHYLNHN